MIRPATTQPDRAAIADFIESLGGEDAHASVGERKLIGLTHGEPALLAEVDGELWGVLLATHGDPTTIEVAAAPGHAGIARALFGHAMTVHPTLRAWSLSDRWGDLLRELGFTAERTLHRMEVTLPVVDTVVEFDETGYHPSHLDDWLSVNNAAFAGHPEQGEWTDEEFIERTELGWWDPDDLRMAWDGDRLAGFCWTKVHDDGSGEIYVIGLHPDYHGRGWGKQLVLEGLRHLHEAKGCEKGLLYVDAANEAALATYERIGFRTTLLDRSYLWSG